jgi:hypothetical protein
MQKHNFEKVNHSHVSTHDPDLLANLSDENQQLKATLDKSKSDYEKLKNEFLKASEERVTYLAHGLTIPKDHWHLERNNLSSRVTSLEQELQKAKEISKQVQAQETIMLHKKNQEETFETNLF